MKGSLLTADWIDCPKCLLLFVTEFPFQIKVAGAPQKATLRFAGRSELLRYHRSLSPFARKSSTTIREAVEFTLLASPIAAAHGVTIWRWIFWQCIRARWIQAGA